VYHHRLQNRNDHYCVYYYGYVNAVVCEQNDRRSCGKESLARFAPHVVQALIVRKRPAQGIGEARVFCKISQKSIEKCGFLLAKSFGFCYLDNRNHYSIRKASSDGPPWWFTG
jgi:hypothetical protein